MQCKELTQVFNAVVALFVVHFNGLRVRAAYSIANAVASHHDVLVFWRRPTHHDAIHQRTHVQGTGHARYLRL